MAPIIITHKSPTTNHQAWRCVRVQETLKIKLRSEMYDIVLKPLFLPSLSSPLLFISHTLSALVTTHYTLYPKSPKTYLPPSFGTSYRVWVYIPTFRSAQQIDTILEVCCCVLSEQGIEADIVFRNKGDGSAVRRVINSLTIFLNILPSHKLRQLCFLHSKHKSSPSPYPQVQARPVSLNPVQSPQCVRLLHA
jgi:hypothetical protein